MKRSENYIQGERKEGRKEDTAKKKREEEEKSLVGGMSYFMGRVGVRKGKKMK